jgi:hypothetical protein
VTSMGSGDGAPQAGGVATPAGAVAQR